VNAFNNEAGGTFTQEGTGTTGFTTAYTGVAFNNAGTVNVSQGELALNSGVAQISGSTLTGGAWDILAGATLSIPNAAITMNDGNVTLNGSGSVFAAINSLAINNGSFSVVGGRAFATTGSLANSGSLSIGGTLNVTGSFTQSAGGTFIEQVGGTQAGQFGILAATGAASLAVTLDVNLTGGFQPNQGTGASFISASSVAGQFSSVVNITLGNPTSFSANYAATAVNLVVTTVPFVDLVVTQEQGPSQLVAGLPGTVTWTTTNQGNIATTAAWHDAVYLSSDGQIDSSASLLATVAEGAPAQLGANGSYQATATFTLPVGVSPGNYFLVVDTDYDKAQTESTYANNTRAVGVTVLPPQPDLVVTGLSVSPTSGLQSGGNLTVKWNDSNTGLGAAASSFSDQVEIVNMATAQTLATAIIAYNASTQGPLVAGGSVAQQYSFQLPNGTAGAGTLQITVTNDVYNQVTKFNPDGTPEASNIATLNTTSALAPYPDLEVTGLSISPASPVSGENITMSWDDSNVGTAPINGSFYDQIVLTNTTTDQTLLSTTSYYDAAIEGAISAGGAAARSVSFTLPNGTPGIGNLQVSINADVYNQVFQAASTSGRTASATIAVAAAAYPDLQVANLAVSPATGVQSGGTIAISWDDANTGNGAVSGAFTDSLTIVNTTTGTTLLNTSLGYNSTADGAIAAGSSFPQSYDFQLPQGSAGAGQIEVEVTANANGGVFVYNAQGTANSNNTASTTFSSALAAYPELAVQRVMGPASVNPGQMTSVAWTLVNTGSAVADGSWSEQVFYGTDASGDNLTLLISSTYTGPLAAGASVPRSALVGIPASAVGNIWFVVTEDADGGVFEEDTANSTGIAATATNVPVALALSLASHVESNVAGPNATSATVTRNGPTTDSLVVTLTNSDATDVSIPATVTIPAGQTSAIFTVGTINNNVVEGNQVATLTASASGLVSGSDVLQVTDSNVPTLSVSFNVPSLEDNAAKPAGTGTVTSNAPGSSQPLTVTLTSNDGLKLTVPQTVTIPAEKTSVTFPLTVVDDNQVDGDANVTVTATANGFNNGVGVLDVLDANIPTMTLSLTSSTVTQSSGAGATMGTITLNAPANREITLALSSDNTSAATVPAEVDVQAGQTSTTFPINAVNNGLDVGNQHADITAQFVSTGGVTLGNNSVTTQLTVLDSNGPALSISLPVAAISASGSTVATVTRNTGTSQALTVLLGSGNTTHATVPPSVVIPAGQTSTTFTITGVDDHLADGEQYAQITAAATNFSSGVTSIGVTTVDLPDLVVSSVTAPASGTANDSANTSWTVLNNGLYPAQGSWVDEVYLDPLNGAQGGGIVDTIAFNGNLNPGQTYTQNDTIALPGDVGQYNLRIVTDPDQSIQELSYGNNTGVANQPINVVAPYITTLSTSITAPVSNGTPIPFTGTATDSSSGLPEANAPVSIWVLVDGTQRQYTATTDGNGNFAFSFQPLPNEAGQYTAIAAYPGVPETQIAAEAENLTPQDTNAAQFTIVGMTATPGNATFKVVPLTPLSGSFTLTNLSGLPLSGLTASAENAPADLDVQLSVPATLGGGKQVTLAYTITAEGTSAENDPVLLHVATAQGAALDIPIDVTVVPTTAMLSANPGYLDVGMLVGAQTSVSFTIANNGGAPTGPIQVQLPAAPYLSLESESTIGSLLPGENSQVTLLLTPAAELALAQYTGDLALSYSGESLSVPFTFTAVTSATGNVQVTVDDDFTFTEAGSPHVSGATVELLNPYETSQVIATATTDSTGVANFTGVTAGPYVMQVSAPGHQTYQASFTVAPGVTNTSEVFLSNQLVTYTWVVVPTEIQDQYTVQLQTTFATYVPAPVVTLSAPQSLPVLQSGQSGQINLTATNHGLIAAEDMQITLPTDPQYTFLALGQQGQTVDVGDVPADSSITIPVTVTYATASGQTAVAGSVRPADQSILPCTLDIPSIYFFTCDGTKHELTAATTIHAPGRVCDPTTIISDFNAAIEAGGGGGGGGGGAAGGGGGGGGGPEIEIEPPPAVLTPVNCNACLANLSASLSIAVLNIFTPLGEINTIISANNIINSLFFGGEAVPGEEAVHTTADLLNKLLDNKLLGQVSSVATLVENTYDAIVHSCLGIGGSGGAGPAPGSDLGEESAVVAADIHALQGDTGDNAALDAALASIETDLQNVETLTGPYQELFGSYDWVQTSQPTTEAEWFAAFMADMQDTSDGTIDAADQAQLLSTTLPSGVSQADAASFIQRWNQSVAYYNQGITTASQLPANASTNFIDLNELQSLLQAASNAEVASQAAGYSDPVTQIVADINQFITANNNASVCASIKMQIDQTVTLTREAFAGTLDISNNESGPLTSVQVQLQFTDANGNPAASAFFTETPTLTGLTAVDGTGVLAAGSQGSVQYTFIPTDTAATNGPTVYNIGGTLSYVVPGSGNEVSVPIYPATITVYPQAELQLNYFLQRDVIGEDPLNPQENIPSEPATLGLLVTNVGAGEADNLSITTAQPQIIEDEKGLLDTFQIIATQVGNQPETPSLTVDLGNLDSGQTADADFLITSTLQGVFSDFTATFQHSDALGGTETSLIDSVTTHDLVHAGNFTYSDSTGAMDYLVDDTPNPDNLPDTIYFSDGTTAPVNIATGVQSTAGPSPGTFTVTASVTSGWDYLQLPDPGAGYTLYKVVRSDGTVIPVSDQAWQTDRTFTPAGESSVDYELHILDDNSTGSYTVYYKPSTVVTPAIASLQQVGGLQSAAVNSVDLTFNEAIDPATFTNGNISLTLNGGANLIDSSVTITQTAPDQFTIGNLAGLTAANGNYVLSVTAAGVSDFFGDTGSGSASDTWTFAPNVPAIVSVGAGNPSLTNTAISTADVVLSEPIVASSFTDAALTLTLNGGPNLIDSGVTITQLSSTTYEIGGLQALTAAQGNYVLTVSAAGLVDSSGNSGVGALGETWTVNTTGPTAVSIGPTPQSPRSIIVPTLDVTFSEPIDPSSFTYQAIVFSKDSGPNLIVPGITITQISPTEFQVGNFENLSAPIDGDYTFTVNAANVQDLAGNSGTGSASVSWDLITSGPAAPTGLAISPNTGVSSSTEGITNVQDVTLTGSLSEPGLVVDVSDNGVDLGDASVTGTTFSEPVTLQAGTNNISVYAVDAAANVSPTTDFTAVYDDSPPVLSQLQSPPAQPSQPVGSLSVTFSEAIVPASFTAADVSLTENGQPVALGGLTITPNAADIVFTLGGLAPLNTAFGAYELTVTASGVQDPAGNIGAGSGSVSWSILGAPTVTASAPNETYTALPYNGATATVAGNGGVVISDGSLSFTYYAAGNLSQALPATPTAAGSYDVVAVFSGDADYVGASSKPVPFTINQAPLTVAGNSISVTYGQPVPALTGSVTGLVGSDATSVVYVFTTSAVQGDSPAVFDITANPSDPLDVLGNYHITYIPATLTINKAVPIVILAGPAATPVYDGTTDVTAWARSAVGGVSGGAAPTGIATLLFYTGPTATGTPLSSPPVNARTYTAVAIYPGDTNYTAVVSDPVTFTISPAPVLLALQSSQAWVLTGQELSLAAIASTVATSNGMPLVPDGAVTFYDNGAAFYSQSLAVVAGQDQVMFETSTLVPGEHRITVGYTSASGNYATTSASPVLTELVFPSDASVLTVTNTSSDPTVSGSLPWAIAQVDASNAATVITFATGSGQVFATPQTITLEAPLEMSDTNLVAIEGPSWGVTLVGDYSKSRFPILSVAQGAGISIQGVSIGTQRPGANGDLQVAGVLDVLQSVANLGSAVSVTGGGTIDLGGQTVTADTLTLTDGSLTDGTFSSGTRTVLSGTISANLTGSGGLVKVGAGTATLSGTNTYTGGTVVSAGTLAVSSATALPGGESLTVGAGGTFLFDPSLSLSPVASALSAGSGEVSPSISKNLAPIGAGSLMTVSSTPPSAVNLQAFALTAPSVSTVAVQTSLPAAGLAGVADAGVVAGTVRAKRESVAQAHDAVLASFTSRLPFAPAAYLWESQGLDNDARKAKTHDHTAYTIDEVLARFV